MNRNKITKKKAVVTAMAGILAVGGIMGASAFFTDQAHTDAKAQVGGLNMTVKDLSDLDGDYSKWDIDQVAGTITEQDSVITTAVKAGVAANAKGDRFHGNYTGRAVTEIAKTDATDKDAPSTGIINPGDSGLLQFKVSNVDSKSFRTGVKSTVIVKLAADAKEPDGAKTATLDKTHIADSEAGTVSMAYPDGTTISETMKYKMADYDAYTIEGMGAPIVAFGYSEDGKTFTETIPDGKTANAMQLTYYTELDTLQGSQENTEATDGKNAEVTYAFETKFNRLSQNKFQGAQIDIKTGFYALENRQTAGTWYSVTAATPQAKDETHSADSKAFDNKLVEATGDWAQYASFEKVINTKENVTDGALTEDANAGSLDAAVADGTAARQ